MSLIHLLKQCTYFGVIKGYRAKVKLAMLLVAIHYEKPDASWEVFLALKYGVD
jgi:hypothetical protein